MTLQYMALVEASYHQPNVSFPASFFSSATRVPTGEDVFLIIPVAHERLEPLASSRDKEPASGSVNSLLYNTTYPDLFLSSLFQTST